MLSSHDSLDTEYTIWSEINQLTNYFIDNEKDVMNTILNSHGILPPYRPPQSKVISINCILWAESNATA